MRIVYMSDIHREIAVRDIPIPECDVIILAGDIGTFRRGHVGNAIEYANDLAVDGRHVVLVPGNHEYYLTTFRETRARAISDEDDGGPAITVMDRGDLQLRTQKGNLRILGATLWTDYMVSGDQTAAMMAAYDCIADHRLIQKTEKHPYRFVPQDALDEHNLSRQWLKDKLAEPFDGQTIIVTHHVPHPAARNPKYPIDHITAVFVSDCSDVIQAAEDAGVKYWIFGHDHWCHDVTVNAVRLLSAQLGYPREDTGWKGPGIIDL